MAKYTVVRSRLATLTAMVIATPLCLSGCGDVAPLSAAHSSLHTAAGSDVLAAPIAEHYAADATATGCLREQTGEMIASRQLNTTGSVTLTDGVITEAVFLATAEGLTDVSFSLTEPIVLRRDGQSGETVDAVGTLIVGTLERRGTVIRLTPDFSDNTASMVATIAMPERLAQSLPPEESAREDTRVLEVTITLHATQ